MMPDLRILALDCASRTGWATNAGPEILSGVQEFALRRGSSPGMRFLEFNRWLEDLIGFARPEIVVYEQAHQRGGAATELCVGFTTRVMEAAARAGLEYRAVHSGTLKRFATGKGSADKAAMIDAANRRFGIGVTDDNEADALLMLAWAQAGFPEREPARKLAQHR